MGADKKVYFRRNMFGGFNKSDVISYMAGQAREQLAERDELTRRNGALEKENKELAEKLSSLQEGASRERERAEAAAQTAERERKRLETDLFAAAGKLEELKADLASATDKLSRARAGENEFSSKVENLLKRIGELTEENRLLSGEVEELKAFKSTIKTLLSSGAEEKNA